ncbi:hypothetical protein ACQCN2_22970 [Brevibacillus ginsengisoli]|uniref:hypothetical protein n=1 Tax=Brevibacillus ginsengisoli TaxID=363854 RepID=UPI003CF113EB
MRKLSWYLRIAIIVISVGVGIMAHSFMKSKPVLLATWLWDASLIQKDPTGVISCLKDEDIRYLYLYIDRTIPMDQYRSFIRNASNEKIAVFALQGDPGWAMAEGRKKSDELKEWLIHYRRDVKEEEQFAGIHLDVEPYLLPDWKTNQTQIVVAYQSLIEGWKKEAMNYQQGLGLDIPFWYDEIKLPQQTLAEWIMDKADSTTIMSYRNFIEGPNGILGITSFEREYAEKKGKKLFLALETEPSHEGDHVSFDSYQVLKDTTDKLWEKGYGVKGISIHHYSSLMKLKKK